MNDKTPPCNGLTDLFFDERIGSPEGEVVEAQAKAICLDCPFKVACLQIGMNESEGIWGGETQYDRRKIKRELRKNK